MLVSRLSTFAICAGLSLVAGEYISNSTGGLSKRVDLGSWNINITSPTFISHAQNGSWANMFNGSAQYYEPSAVRPTGVDAAQTVINCNTTSDSPLASDIQILASAYTGRFGFWCCHTPRNGEQCTHQPNLGDWNPAGAAKQVNARICGKEPVCMECWQVGIQMYEVANHCLWTNMTDVALAAHENAGLAGGTVAFQWQNGQTTSIEVYLPDGPVTTRVGKARRAYS